MDSQIEMEATMQQSKSMVDAYGFERDESFDQHAYDEFMSRYLSTLARRAGKWESYMKVKSGAPLDDSSAKLKRYIRKGIPGAFRPKVWMQVSGAKDKMEANPHKYAELLQMNQETNLVRTINLDLPRTFPDNIYFQNAPSSPHAKRTKLFNVLMALAQKHPEIGYCQGLNFVAGLLLLVVNNEEEVFWLLDTLVTDILPEYYTPEMMGIRVDQEVLGELIKSKIPDVHSYLEKNGMHWGLVCTKWFICLYVDVLPIETVLRIWDCLFYEGSKILFRVGVTLVKKHREQLLACRNFPEIIQTLKQITSDTTVLQCHEFVESIFNETGSFPMSLIVKLRETHRQRLVKESS